MARSCGESGGARRLEAALAAVAERLLAARSAAGGWRGELSESALSTATASLALRVSERGSAEDNGAGGRKDLAAAGLDWLAAHPNADGGWGDTARSLSNISTTLLSWAALSVEPDGPGRRQAIERAETWIRTRTGSLEPEALARAVLDVYGKDRTFSVPILTHCALAGRLGAGRDAWRHVLQLPFELAALPRSWFRFLGLPVVSYALPALIAMGQARHHHLPAGNPAARLVRSLVRERTLRVLERIQPASGGFLEATPLTSFVAMSLAASGQAGHAVTRRAARFLEASARGSGAWPIDSDLSSWVTTLSVKALAAAGLLEPALSEAERMKLAEELVSRQYREVHPYTGASPGGWAWTDLPGGVPDADDTAGALLALRLLAPDSAAARRAAARGLCWLLDLQNRDGGLPTFCRGWGKLPFDRSGADLTAHALSAFLAWAGDLGGEAGLDARRIERAARRAIAYLREAQNAGGSWTPLWFGNERAPGFENRTYGTARVVGALEDAAARGLEVDDLLYRGRSWLRAAQNPDGGWGGAAGVESSVEETALAVAALASRDERKREDSLRENLRRGAAWLVEAVESGAIDTPSPIGFYFANLWYHEKLYPWIFTLEALGRMQQDSRV